MLDMQSQPIATDQLVGFLRTTRLFARVDEAALRAIAPELAALRYDAGAVVIREGDPAAGLYLVQRGRLRVVSHTQDGGEVFLNAIEVGESVGEIALLTGERRTATVHASAASELLWFSREQFEQLGRRYPTAAAAIADAIVVRLEQAQLNLALHVSKLFDRLDEPVLRALRAELELVVFHGGQAVVRQGQPSDALYLVINGRLRVVREQADGTATTLYELRRGQTVGEIGILTSGPRTATVYAVRDSLLARLSRAGFDRLLAAYPQAIVRQFAAPVVSMLQEQTTRPRRPDNDVATIAIVPIASHVPVSAFAAQLAAALAVAGPTLHLTSAGVERALAQPGLAQARPDAPISLALVRWLAEQETSYRYVIYEADPTVSPWTERCLRQADRIVLVGEAGGSPEPGPIERALLRPDGTDLSAERSLVLLHPPDAERPSDTRRWLDARRLASHYHVRRDNPSDMARLGRLLIGRGVGVVLSGGGAAGFAHIGAIRALREAGIPIDLIGGTSQGGLMACQHAMGWDDGTTMAKNHAAIRHKFDYTFPITALMAGAEMTDVVQEMFGNAQLEDLWIPCFCVTANLSRAAMVVHDRGPVWKYTRATTSLPGVLPPVIDDGDMLVDGGLLNNLPTDVMRGRGDCGVVFACDASSPGSPHDRNPPYETSISGWKLLLRRLTPFAPRLPAPTIGQIMMRVAIINDAQHMQTARSLAEFYMRLVVGTYGKLEFGALDQIVAAGYQSAQATVAAWRDDQKFRMLRTSQ
jgi:predicted acylesterase/phospholipase RssA/CRP-like cAMP-binding protein